MSELETGRLTRAQLLQYFVDAATPRKDWLVGMELERMGRDAQSGAPLAYDGPKPNIRALIEAYREMRNGESVCEGPHIIGLNGDWGNISLEPGGQFEWSSRPYDQLAGLEAAYLEHQQWPDHPRECGLTFGDQVRTSRSEIVLDHGKRCAHDDDDQNEQGHSNHHEKTTASPSSSAGVQPSRHADRRSEERQIKCVWAGPT